MKNNLIKKQKLYKIRNKSESYSKSVKYKTVDTGVKWNGTQLLLVKS